VKRRFRLTGTADFKRVRHSGKSYAHPLVVLVVLPNGLEISRFAVTAGRSVGNAVQRNRAKRMIRAALASHLKHTATGWDVIVIARRAIRGVNNSVKFNGLSEVITGLLSSAGLIDGK
jgi:ribonuclease P protein component